MLFLGSQSKFFGVDLSVRVGTYSFDEKHFPQVRGCSSIKTLVRQEQNLEFNSLPNW